MHYIIYRVGGKVDALAWNKPLPDPLSYPEPYNLPPLAELVAIASDPAALFIINSASPTCPPSPSTTEASSSKSSTSEIQVQGRLAV